MASTNHTTEKLSEEAKAPVLALLARGQKAGVLQSSEILSVMVFCFTEFLPEAPRRQQRWQRRH